VKEGFSLWKKPRKRMKDNPANPIMIPFDRNEEWAIDFMHDVLESGRKFRTFSVIDHYNREALGILNQCSIPARRATVLLDQLIEKYGKPKRIRGDNGPEMMSKWFRLWLQERKIEWSAIQKVRHSKTLSLNVLIVPIVRMYLMQTSFIPSSMHSS
jgi:putative transposase